MTANDELDLSSVVAIAWRHRSLVAAAVLFFGALACAAAFLMTPVYRGEALLAPARDGDGTGTLGALMGQAGGLASLIGVAVPGTRQTEEAVATLRSRMLLEAFVRERDLTKVLFSKRWDAKAARWRDSDPAEVPTMGDALKMLQERVLDVSADVKTGLFTLRIDWYDPDIAADWANDIVRRANDLMRARAIRDADRSLRYLDGELARATTVEVRAAIYRLIESQLKARMLASIREEYSFSVVDPARAPDRDKPVRPKKMLIVTAGLVAGLLAGLAIAVLRERRRMRSSLAF